MNRDRLTGKSPFHPARSAGFGYCYQIVAAYFGTVHRLIAYRRRRMAAAENHLPGLSWRFNRRYSGIKSHIFIDFSHFAPIFRTDAARYRSAISW
jgi:hypothetical protein